MALEAPRWREERARVFFALWPDADTAETLHRLAVSAQQRYGGRSMQRDTLHLTLAFIGGVPRVRIPELIEAGAAVAPRAFGMTLDVLGEWARKNLVWVGPAQLPDGLSSLQQELHAALVQAGFALESRPFVPHVTLVRNAQCETRRTDLDTAVEWTANGFLLVESRLDPSGARYHALARWSATA